MFKLAMQHFVVLHHHSLSSYYLLA